MTPSEVTVPDLAPTPALGNIDSNDISLPRLYKGEYQSQLVQDDVVPKGCIHVSSGADDPDPNVIWERPKNGEPAAGDGVLVHILSAHKGKSANVDEAGNVVKAGGTFTTWRFNDPAAPAEANVDYHYVVALPEVDPDIPVKVTFSKTSVPAAKRINFLLKKNEQAGPPHRLAFRLTTDAREKKDGGQTYKWFVWQARQVEADQKHIDIAANVAQLVAQAPQAAAAIERTAGPGNQPQI